MGELIIIRLWKKSKTIGEMSRTIDTIYCYTQYNGKFKALGIFAKQKSLCPSIYLISHS